MKLAPVAASTIAAGGGSRTKVLLTSDRAVSQPGPAARAMRLIQTLWRTETRR